MHAVVRPFVSQHVRPQYCVDKTQSIVVFKQDAASQYLCSNTT